jgi:hypothetical protein
MNLLGAEEFRRLCEAFERTAFRLETRDRYADEREPLRRFLAGEPPDDAWFMDWYEAIERTGRGSWVCPTKTSGSSMPLAFWSFTSTVTSFSALSWSPIQSKSLSVANGRTLPGGTPSR